MQAISNSVYSAVKPARLLGDSLECIRAFPAAIRLEVGYQIETLQRGGQPSDFKPMPTIGAGVEEIRARSGLGAYRVIYTSRMADAIVVLHAFQKKSRSTSRLDLQIAKTRFNQLKRSST